ncbi:MAG: hypothetical protein KF808_05600 [Cryobacterium sp.]|nr:hypothetical protein [Cryobacterium sp.]
MKYSEDSSEEPLYSARRKRVMRVVVLIAVAAMLIPLFANLFSVSAASAASSCARAVHYEVSDATGSSARFELFGPGVVGWECYAVGGFSAGRHVISLGIIPGMVELPKGVDA